MAEDIIVKIQGDVAGLTKSLNDVKKQLADLQAQAGKPLPVGGKTLPATIKATKREFDGLGNSINQLSRELPAFTYSAQTGFLALSNNIPILADQIAKLKAQNLELTASGQKSIPIWKSVAKALFSWQTALSLGVTLITVFGKEIFSAIGSLFGYGKAAKLAEEQQIKLAAETEELNKKFKEEAELIAKIFPKKGTGEVLGVLSTGAERAKLSTEELTNALGDLKKQLDNVTVDNQFQVFDDAVNNSQMTTEEWSKQVTKLYEAERNDILKNIKIIEDELKLRSKRVGQAEEEKEPLNEYKQLLKDIGDIEEKMLVTLTKGQKVDQKTLDNLRTKKNRLKDITEENKKNLLVISDIVKLELIQKEIELTQIQTDRSAQDQALNDELKKRKEISDLRRQDELDRINKMQEAVNFAFDIEKNISQVFSNLTETQVNSVEEVAERRLKILDQQLKKGIINEEQFADAKLKIETESDAEIVKLRRKQAEREKLIATFEATIKGGLAILEAAATGGPLLAAATSILVGTQIAAIQTAPLPQLEKGGEIKIGKRHSQGGTVIEAEIGEYVNTRASTAKYKEELEAANNLSLDTLISRKYVIPALQRQKEVIKQQVLNNFHDGNILNEHREDRKLYREMIGLLKTRKTSNIRFRNV